MTPRILLSTAVLLWSIVVAVGVSACRSQDQMLTHQNKTLTSLRSTIISVGDAWLSGTVSSTFTRTSLENTLQLLETSRSQLVASPQLLADRRFADLAQSADRLTRVVGLLWKSVGDGDTGEVRRQLADIRSPHRAQP
jgi:hypothetical protein